MPAAAFAEMARAGRPALRIRFRETDDVTNGGLTTYNCDKSHSFLPSGLAP